MLNKQLDIAFQSKNFIVVKGPTATGKSTAVKWFLDKNKIEYSYLTTHYDSDNCLNILNANGYKGKTIEKSLKKFIASLSRKTPVVFLDRIEKFSESNLGIIINSLASIKNMKILFTINSDSKNCENILEKLPYSKSIIETNNKIVNEYIIKNKDNLLNGVNVSHIPSDQLERYISFCDNFDSFNNLCLIIKHADYDLINNNYTLLEFMKNAIYAKLQKIPEPAQTILKKSSVLGEIFEEKHLNTPLGLDCINQALSLLITNNAIKKLDPDLNKYKFEPTMARDLIYNAINLEDKNKWNELVGDYYFECYSKTKNIANGFTFLSKAICHYNEINTTYLSPEKLSRCFLLIKHCFSYNILDNIVNYSVNALKKCENLALMRSYRAQILWLCEKNSFWEDCLNILEQTEEVIGATPEERNHIRYLKASCLFNTNREAEAQNEFELLYYATTDKLLKFKIASWLYSIYFDIGDNIKKDKYLRLTSSAIMELPKGLFVVDYEVNNFYRKVGMYGNYPNVLKKLNEAINFFKSHGLCMDAAKCQHNLGIAYLRNKNYEEALIVFNQALENFGLSSNSVYSEIGMAAVLCLRDGNWQGAINLYLNALNKYSIDNFIKIEIYVNLASCFYKLHDINNRDFYLDKALKLIELSNNNGYKSCFYNQFIDMFYIMCDIEQGKRDIKKLYNFKASDEEYEQIIGILIAKMENKINPYSQFTANIIADIIDKNIFPHYLLFWE